MPKWVALYSSMASLMQSYTVDDYAEFVSVSEELSAYKYLYHIHFTVRDGQIWYTHAGNSRRECMAQARENLLWLMSLT